ncbi:hypothetical protein BpHYR1_026532 [Brachionus plicatilis]|uniref:Uncharacterized protein n=1 Tax=Brachionus plicatilis TaxID=10195 RepID=A0A3M7P6H2_BRAPC|nr:hypothetical protein BpHYR1_026532 [Brachionus plicatilis]
MNTDVYPKSWIDIRRSAEAMGSRNHETLHAQSPGVASVPLITLAGSSRGLSPHPVLPNVPLNAKAIIANNDLIIGSMLFLLKSKISQILLSNHYCNLIGEIQFDFFENFVLIRNDSLVRNKG